MKKARRYLVLVCVLVLALLVACGTDEENVSAQGNQDPSTQSSSTELQTAETTAEPVEQKPLSISLESSEAEISEEILTNAVMPLLEANQEFYTVTEPRIYGIAEVQGQEEGRLFSFFLEFHIQTKFTKAEELPMVQGLLAESGFANMEDCNAAIQDASDAQRQALAKQVQEFVAAVELDLADTDVSYSLAVMTDKDGNYVQTYGVADEMQLYSFEDCFPQSADELYAQGVALAQDWKTSAD